MSTFATFDAEGRVTAFYNSAVHDPVPFDAIAVTPEQYNDLVVNQHERRLINGVIAPYEAPPQPLTIADYSSAIQAHLDATARARQYDNIHTAISYRADQTRSFPPRRTRCLLGDRPSGRSRRTNSKRWQRVHARSRLSMSSLPS